MADKQIQFTDKDQQQMEAILIDRDKGEAIKYLASVVQKIKGTAGQACGTGPIK